MGVDGDERSSDDYGGARKANDEARRRPVAWAPAVHDWMYAYNSGSDDFTSNVVQPGVVVRCSDDGVSKVGGVKSGDVDGSDGVVQLGGVGDIDGAVNRQRARHRAPLRGIVMCVDDVSGGDGDMINSVDGSDGIVAVDGRCTRVNRHDQRQQRERRRRRAHQQRRRRRVTRSAT